jgi:4-hydroxyphenylpyruvate dioxygenase-like putative hemolysin
MPGCYPPPALSNYSSATDLQLKGFFQDHAQGLVPLFEVEDAQQAAAELRAAGADVIGNPDSDGTWTWIHVRAPDGNLYEFASRRRGEPD